MMVGDMVVVGVAGVGVPLGGDDVIDGDEN